MSQDETGIALIKLVQTRLNKIDKAREKGEDVPVEVELKLYSLLDGLASNVGTPPLTS